MSLRGDKKAPTVATLHHAEDIGVQSSFSKLLQVEQGAGGNMEQTNSIIDDGDATEDSRYHSLRRPGPICGTRPRCCENRLGWPPDSLTRLMMKADGVTEEALGVLVRRIAAVLASG
jgi:hypothetical protein